LQEPKQRLPRIVTVDGIQIELSDWHPSKASAGMLSSPEPDSNRNSEIEMQKQKQRLPGTVTDDGTQIDFSDEHPSKADLPIRNRSDSDSNITDDMVGL
jgi:hypothetical protein